MLHPWITDNFAHTIKKSTKVVSPRTSTIPLTYYNHIPQDKSSLRAPVKLGIHPAAYLKFSSGHKILHSPDDFHSCSVCFCQSAKEHKHRQTSAGERRKNVLIEDVDSKHRNLQLCLQNCSIARSGCMNALFCCSAFLKIVVLRIPNG